MTLKLGSLFDGSGGFPLAGVLHGVEPAWASEIEPYPIRVTKARFPAMKHLGSVLDVNGAEVEPVDIITFGSPCQDLSVAGKQAGLHKGERSNLFFEAIRIIKEMREAHDGLYPRIAIWENVPGAFSSNKGADFQAVLQAFCSVKDEAADVPRPSTGKWNPAGAIVGNGWSVAWRTFDAQYWGVPQRRRRIYLIADFGSERAGEVLFEQDRVRGDSAESGTEGESVAADAEGSVGGGGVNCLTPHEVQTQRIYGVDGVYPAIPANSNGGQNRQAICFQASGDRDNPSISTSEKAYCIPANPMSDRGQAVCFQQNQREEVRLFGDKTGAIAANGGAHQTNYIMFKERAGCPGGGKGILCGDKPFTLSTLTDQAVCYAAAFMGGQGDKARSIAWTEEATPPLKAVPSGSNTVPDVCYAVDRYNQTIADTMQTVRPAVGGDNVGAVCYPAGNGQPNQSLLKEQARTLDCMHDQQIVIKPSKPPRKYIIRRLTPLECLRLQGLPDGWLDGVDGSDSAKYKMLGNGIAMPNAIYVVGCAVQLLQEGKHENEG